MSSEFDCPISHVSSASSTWFELSFHIGKRGSREDYDNISGLAEYMLNSPDSVDNIHAIKELKQYKDKHIILNFNFHPWRKQGNEGILKFVNVNKAFGEYISEFKMVLRAVLNDVQKETWRQLFAGIKYNCLYHKLYIIELNTYGNNVHSQPIFEGMMDLIQCESKLTTLSILEIEDEYISKYIDVYFVHLVNVIKCYEMIIESLEGHQIPNEITKLILQQVGKRNGINMNLSTGFGFNSDELNACTTQESLTKRASTCMNQAGLLLNKYTQVFDYKMEAMNDSTNKTYPMSQFKQYMSFFFKTDTNLNVDNKQLFRK